MTYNARDETLADDLHDVVTHRSAWRSALIECRERSKSFTDDADESYWEHELKAFDRTFDKLAALRAAPQAPDTERSPTNDKPLHPTNGPFRWDPKHGNWVADLTAPDTGMREALEVPTLIKLLEEICAPVVHGNMPHHVREEMVAKLKIVHAGLTAIAALSRPPHVADTREGDAARYRWLRSRDENVIHAGGVFIGVTPDNLVVTLEDADAMIDAAMGNAVIRALASGADEKGGEK